MSETVNEAVNKEMITQLTKEGGEACCQSEDNY